MWFGLQPPTNAPVPWGACAIMDMRGGYGTLDLLANRQQSRGDEGHNSALQAWLNQGDLPELSRRVWSSI